MSEQERAHRPSLRHTHVRSVVVFLCLDLFICENKYVFSTLKWSKLFYICLQKKIEMYADTCRQPDHAFFGNIKEPGHLFFLQFLLFTYWLLFLFQQLCCFFQVPVITQTLGGA